MTLSEPGKELEVGDEDEDEDMYDEDVYEFDELSSAVYCFTHDPSVSQLKLDHFWDRRAFGVMKSSVYPILRGWIKGVV